MFLEIEQTSPIAIYTQLTSQIKKAIVKETLVAGDDLPSVRVLASDLGVNMHTVNKAYNILTEEGLLLKSKKGYVVSPKINRQTDEEQEDEMKKRLEDVLVDILVHNHSEKTVQEWLSELTVALRKGDN
ncbi:GntR family transcriptional regulator [Jeotgalibaca arthritidis]|uniref:GntR family transcriptional regulator n=1 Tax=Jeotgalibaca arthritidis TaxID=1868794 RepID=A0A6G7K778_9LACT|nr:GntR family transcriptional regulator [Jeotgalibaca arthritidis]QII81114.1 GntR family transcriptional regulator [Jeotgalibaca arthritidis]